MHPLDQLLQAQPRLWRGRQHPQGQRTEPSGNARLDAFLPGGGWPLGALTELLTPPSGGGEFSLLMPSLKRLTAQQEWVALVAPPWLPYPPALARAGIDLSHLLVVQPDQPTEAAWATEQLLRSGGFRAVLAWLPRVSTTRLRRLQLAAEAGGDVWALVYRPESALGEASPAALRLHFSAATSPEHGGPQLQVVKCRGDNPGSLLLGQRPRPTPHTEHTPAVGRRGMPQHAANDG